MPDNPDFDHVARLLVHELDQICANLDAREAVRLMREQLRLVWNARGAADLVKVDAELTAMMGSTAGGPYVKNLDRALRTLDR